MNDTKTGRWWQDPDAAEHEGIKVPCLEVRRSEAGASPTHLVPYLDD